MQPESPTVRHPHNPHEQQVWNTTIRELETRRLLPWYAQTAITITRWLDRQTLHLHQRRTRRNPHNDHTA
jgi:hypothetical protein